MYLEIVSLFIFLIVFLSYFHSPSRYYIKFAYFTSAAIFTAFITTPIFCLRPKDIRNSRWSYKLLHVLSSIFLGIKWEILGEDRLKKNFPCVAVCNHQSILDLNTQSIVCWRTSGFIAIAKKSILYIFPIGPNGWLSGVVFIDRSRGKESREQIRAAGEKCHDAGVPLFVFPEGTRNSKPELLPFKTGAFDVAIKARLPILPVVTSPYYFIDHKAKQFNSGRVIVSVLPPIPTTPEMDVENLAQEVRNVMNEEYKRLSSLVLQNNNKSE